MATPERFRHQHCDRLAEDLAGVVAEGLFGAPVEQHDTLRAVDADDRVHGELDDHREPRLARAQGLDFLDQLVPA